jgi:2-oxo-4-hydroxy-4-carboxy-5-ureidoimidazoline decarboxylase
MKLHEINCFTAAEAEDQFLRCCGSRAWAAGMAAARPFAGRTDVYQAAERVWRALPREDRMEAFAAHPRIGDVNSLRKKYENTKAWASGEQAGVNAADEAVLQELAEGNRAYEEKFGFIFIVCATGKSAAEMLALLNARLPLARDEEILNAGAEQMKITRIRLDKWLSDAA